MRSPNIQATRTICSCADVKTSISLDFCTYRWLARFLGWNNIVVTIHSLNYILFLHRYFTCNSKAHWDTGKLTFIFSTPCQHITGRLFFPLISLLIKLSFIRCFYSSLVHSDLTVSSSVWWFGGCVFCSHTTPYILAPKWISEKCV